MLLWEIAALGEGRAGLLGAEQPQGAFGFGSDPKYRIFLERGE